MEECGNKKHNDYNKNKTDASKNTIKKGKITCPDITFLDIMEECGNAKHNDNNDNENKPVRISWIREKKNTKISHPQL